MQGFQEILSPYFEAGAQFPWKGVAGARLPRCTLKADTGVHIDSPHRN
jgi:hypothetical protein